MKKKKDRDLEKGYTVKQMVAKLRRLADCLENDKSFRIQIAGEKLNIPSKAIFNIEHESKILRLMVEEGDPSNKLT